MIQLCLEVLDHEGVRVIFTEQQRQLKISKHPELQEADFISHRLKTAIQNPDFAYQDFEKPSKRIAVYKREYKFGSRIRYTKIILEKRKHHYFVITAYRPDYVKERGKTTLIHGKDN